MTELHRAQALRQQRVLDWIKTGVTEVLPYELLVETSPNFFRDEVLLRMSRKLLGERLPSTMYPSERFQIVPASTWQMFKQLHARAWWLRGWVRRWPVRMADTVVSCTIAIEAGRVYPDQTLVDPRLGQPVIIEYLEPAQWSVDYA